MAKNNLGPSLAKGAVIKAANGDKYTVEAFLGAGGQGEVYRVRGRAGTLALKWYHADRYLKQINSKAFYENLANNVERGVPAQSSGDTAAQFIWPLVLVPPQMGSFGYMMELFPQGYVGMDRVILGYVKDKSGKKIPVRWKSYQVMLTAALNIVRAFEILHSQGLSYQDINEGGISVNTNTGDVLICDCDNVSPDQTNLGIRGVMNYMAPEVLRGTKLPDRHSDVYSLAIILFRIFFYNHPMEGEESIRLRSDDNLSRRQADERIYGDPHYCLDYKNPINRPADKHSDVRRRCMQFPNILLEAFDTVFTKGVNNPGARLTTTQWRKVLTKVRDCLVFCDGKEKFFYTPMKSDLPANSCVLTGGGRRVICMDGKLLYPYHFDEYSHDFAKPMAKIILVPQRNMLALYNGSGKEIEATLQGSTKRFGNEDYIPLISGMELKLGYTKMKVE